MAKELGDTIAQTASFVIDVVLAHWWKVALAVIALIVLGFMA